jgi:hypothetical protein
MVPWPVPAKSTVSDGPVPVKQTTLAVMFPVTMAPDESTFPVLWFVFTVAETNALPHPSPVAVSNPEESTVTIPGVFEVHMAWAVTSLVTGGWI